ncbi:MAG: ligase-associated DNA damage response DEXH box helicase [Planctomycetota bacterium]
MALATSVNPDKDIIKPRELLRSHFEALGWSAFPFQKQVWRAYAQGKSGLVHSATGTGKTLAVWGGPLLQWMRLNRDRSKWNVKRPAALQALWITPLRALAGDTEEALRGPLEQLQLPWRLESRTGDSKASTKSRQLKKLPSALVTTPESLSLMLTHERLAEPFRSLRAVIVDEWHELLGTKRGVQTELALARLRQLAPEMRTWGVSATLGNLQQAMESLVGSDNRDHAVVIEGYKRKKLQISTILPPKIERFPWSGHIGTRMVPEVTEVIQQARSSLIFANTRSQTEIWYAKLLEQRSDWAGQIALHHGSLDATVRKWVENGLRAGELKSVVCTSSLDLGVDYTAVDLVVQVGSPKGAARLLQRAGRSGHQFHATSKLAFVPTNALELLELAAAKDAIAQNQLESRPLIQCPLDVLAQHLVTLAIGGGFDPDETLAEIRGTLAFESLTNQQWRWVLDFIVRGGSSLEAYPEFKRVEIVDGRYVVRERRVASAHRMNIGTIVSDAAMIVKYMTGGRLGTAEESFLSKLQPGDKFLFAGRLVELVHIKENQAYVRRTKGSPDTVPRWMGGRMPLSSELSRNMRLRLDEASEGTFRGPELKRLKPLLQLQAEWSRLPSSDIFLIESIKTRDGHQLFFYPFAGRLAHEGLSALFAKRISELEKISFSMACNDYGFVLRSDRRAPIDQAINSGLFSMSHLEADVLDSMNATEMTKRGFRSIARVAGLIQEGYPGQKKPNRYLQASSNLFYDVFTRYDPDNLLLAQAQREVLDQQLDVQRIAAALAQIAKQKLTITSPPKITPLSFSLLVDRLRERVSSETLADRVRRMQEQLERDAQRSGRS